MSTCLRTATRRFGPMWCFWSMASRCCLWRRRRRRTRRDRRGVRSGLPLPPRGPGVAFGGAGSLGDEPRSLRLRGDLESLARGLFDWRDEAAGDFETLVKTFVRPAASAARPDATSSSSRAPTTSFRRSILRPHQMRAVERVVERAQGRRRSAAGWSGTRRGRARPTR